MPAGHSIVGMGSLNDPVSCQGTITASGGAINLNNGLLVSGSGSVNLGSGTLTVNDLVSGISGGTLNAPEQYVGMAGTATFTQTAGSNLFDQVILGNNAGSNGTYKLNGGILVGIFQSNTGDQYVGYSGSGNFRTPPGIITSNICISATMPAAAARTTSAAAASWRQNGHTWAIPAAAFTQSGAEQQQQFLRLSRLQPR